MKASKYQRRHEGALPDAILAALMEYHGCQHHNGPRSGACLADFKRTDIIMDVVVAQRDLPVVLPVAVRERMGS
jgi:hypothetical protein